MYLPNHIQDATQVKIFKQSTVGLNSEFSFFYTGYLTNNPVCSTITPVARWRIDVFMS